MMNSATEEIVKTPGIQPKQRGMNMQFRNSEDTGQMRQIQLEYNNTEQYGATRQNRVQSMNIPVNISPSSSMHLNSSNKVKKVFIYTGGDDNNNIDSKLTTAGSPMQDQIFREQQSSIHASPSILAKTATAKGILKSHKQTPLIQGLSNDNLIRDKNLSLSFTSAHEEQRRQSSIGSKLDQNNNSCFINQDYNQASPFNVRKPHPSYKQLIHPQPVQDSSSTPEKYNDFLNSRFSVQLPQLKKESSISSNQGAQSDQTHNKSAQSRKYSSNSEQRNKYGQSIQKSPNLYSKNQQSQLNQSVDLSTTNTANSDFNMTLNQIRANYNEYATHSPLRQKIMASQSPATDSYINLNDQTNNFRATNQKFRITNSSSFVQKQSNTSLDDNINENNQKDALNSKFLHSQSYLRKRIQSIDNQKPQGSLPHINEEINEDGPLSHKESMPTTEEVNRKKQMLLQRLKQGSTPNKFHYDEYYDNQKIEDKLYDPSSISILHPSRNLYDDKNPLRAYQIRSNIPLSNQRIVTDPSTYTHQLYYKANQKRQKDQERVIQLLEEQDKIMNRILNKYHVRAKQEENHLKQKLQELEKDRDSLVKLKEQEHMLGLMHLNLNSKVESFKKNMSFYNNSMAPNMPALRPNMENAFSDMQDLAFLDSILKQSKLTDEKKKTLHRKQTKIRNKSSITCNYNNNNIM